MALTKVEKIAGRWFRDDQQARLTASWETDPPDHNSPTFLSNMRHECPGRNDLAVALELKEVYVFSPELVVLTDGTVAIAADEHNDPSFLVQAVIPEGRFGFRWKAGSCKYKGCGQTARSKAGKFEDAYERPPVEGRVSRA